MAEAGRISIMPRVLTAPQTARYLGRSPSWFYEHRAELEADGFPKRLDRLDAYDRFAVDDWLDRVGGRLSERQTDRKRKWTRRR